MELLQLRYFLVAAKYEHMTKAAEVLRIAQPALSQSIKRLEQELGIPLFDREKRNIRLNDAGRFLEQKLLPIMAALEELPAEIKKRDLMNQRTIYLNLLAATRLVTDCIIAYKELHPEVIFRLVQDPAREHDDICISTAFPGEFKHEEDHLLLRERIFYGCSGRFCLRFPAFCQPVHASGRRFYQPLQQPPHPAYLRSLLPGSRLRPSHRL